MTVLRLAAPAMGTRFEVVLPVPGGTGGAARARAAAEEALEIVAEEERRWSAFRRDSLLAHIEREAWRGPVRLDEDAFELFEEALAVGAASAGAFDACLGAAMAANGFRGARRGAPEAPLGPGYSLDAAARSVRLAAAGVRLDLGALAKGHALDLCARALREAGFSRAFLHGGTSTCIGLGAPPGSDAWRVALGPEPGAPVVALVDAALSLSAPRGRRNGVGEGHLLDGRTGKPAAGEGAVAVTARSARSADAWSTALAVLGRLPATDALLGAYQFDTLRGWRTLPAPLSCTLSP